jgi:hypothetical protein
VPVERDRRAGADGLRRIVGGRAVDRDPAAAREAFDRAARAEPGEREEPVQADFRGRLPAPVLRGRALAEEPAPCGRFLPARAGGGVGAPVLLRSVSTSAGVRKRQVPGARPPSVRPP